MLLQKYQLKGYFTVSFYVPVFSVPPNSGRTHKIKETLFTLFLNKTQLENPRNQRKKLLPAQQMHKF